MSKTETLEAEEVREKSTKHRTVSEELLTVREVARALRVDDTTVRRWIKNSALNAVSLPHVGKRCAYRVRRNTLEALLTEGTEED